MSYGFERIKKSRIRDFNLRTDMNTHKFLVFIHNIITCYGNNNDISEIFSKYILEYKKIFERD
jgi:hypothetical protein